MDSWRAHHGQLVERPLRSQLLDDPDERVGDQDDPEERVLQLADHKDDHEQDTEDEVEQREDVGPQDLDGRPACALSTRVGETLDDALIDVARTQPCCRCRGRFGVDAGAALLWLAVQGPRWGGRGTPRSSHEHPARPHESRIARECEVRAHQEEGTARERPRGTPMCLTARRRPSRAEPSGDVSTSYRWGVQRSRSGRSRQQHSRLAHRTSTSPRSTMQPHSAQATSTDRRVPSEQHEHPGQRTAGGSVSLERHLPRAPCGTRSGPRGCRCTAQ